MKFRDLLNRNKAREPKTFEAVKSDEITKRIRLRYSVSDELAIQRKRNTEIDEFNEYNEYVEQCIADAKADLGID